MNARARRELARRLWGHCPSPLSPRSVTLLMTAAVFPEARALWSTSPIAARARFLAWAVRRTTSLISLRDVRERHSAYAYPREIEFVDDLPKTLTGKIRRVELREQELRSKRQH